MYYVHYGTWIQEFCLFFYRWLTSQYLIYFCTTRMSGSSVMLRSVTSRTINYYCTEFRSNLMLHKIQGNNSHKNWLHFDLLTLWPWHDQATYPCTYNGCYKQKCYQMGLRFPPWSTVLDFCSWGRHGVQSDPGTEQTWSGGTHGWSLSMEKRQEFKKIILEYILMYMYTEPRAQWPWPLTSNMKRILDLYGILR